MYNSPCSSSLSKSKHQTIKNIFIYLFHGNLKMEAGNLLKFYLLGTSLLSLNYLHHYNILACKFMFVTLSLYMLRFDNIVKSEGLKSYNL